MKQELDRVRTEVVRWARTPTFISAELLRKDQPSFGERLWIYRAIWMAPLLIAAFVISLLWAVLPYTMHGWAVLSTLGFGTWAAVDVGFAIVRLGGDGDPLHPTEGFLSYTGRRKVVLYDRNRRRMPWHTSRHARAKEADGKHPHLSVWMEPTNSGVQFHVLAHYRSLVGPWHVRKFEKAGRPASNHLRKPDAEEILDERERLETFARDAEEGLYGEVEAQWAMLRDVLSFRR